VFKPYETSLATLNRMEVQKPFRARFIIKRKTTRSSVVFGISDGLFKLVTIQL
jgi:hypothetical protein